jgi:GH15 family glucan-1,4-alpha-glucosidase
MRSGLRRKHGFAPIRAYAAIGDGRTVALVAADGAIDFLSLPALHCPTVFGALLDPDQGGRSTLEPRERYEVERRYVGRSNVLETTFRTRDGAVRVTDALALHGGGLPPWLEVSRRVEGLSGEVPMRWSVAPRFDWGRAGAGLTLQHGVPVAAHAGVRIGVHCWDAGDAETTEDAVEGAFTAREGSRALLALCCTENEPLPVPRRDAVERRLDEAVEVWERWLAGWHWEGPWEEAVARSALALKLLVYSPLGAIAAAPTTSLPERIGGDRNYDYRYFWVRDSAFTIDALLRLGLPEQVHESFACLLRAIKTTAPDLSPFYTIDGRPGRRYEELPLRGYRDSRPVRYGNAATQQLQLGCWGDLLETADLYVRDGNLLDPSTAELLAGCVDRLCVIWHDADSGMWELPQRRRYTVSRLATWMAFDRAVRLARDEQLPSTHLGRWSEERDNVRTYVESRCWSEDLGAYVEFPGAQTLDAGVLRAGRMGWGDVSTARLQSTIQVVGERLDAGRPLLFRTTEHAGEEAAFVACSFWQVEALARTGRVDEAAALFEELLSLANDVGLYSEEIDPDTHDFLGNFPQGLSHLALINAAGAIDDARDAAPSATEGATAR